MNYKFSFILTEAKDYIRKIDLSYMDFINEIHKKELKFSFDPDDILYIEEDVNMNRSEKFMKLLKEQNIETTYVSVVKWKTIPKLN